MGESLPQNVAGSFPLSLDPYLLIFGSSKASVALKHMVCTKPLNDKRIIHPIVTPLQTIIRCPNLRRGVAGSEYRVASTWLAIVKVPAFLVWYVDGTIQGPARRPRVLPCLQFGKKGVAGISFLVKS